MEPQIKLIAELMKKLNETVSETKTLYDISEAEMHFLIYVIIEAASMGLSPKLTAKILKAAAHFIETSHDVTELYVKDLFK